MDEELETQDQAQLQAASPVQRAGLAVLLGTAMLLCVFAIIVSL